MPVQFKQVISSFLTQSAYKELTVSAAWHILPGFEVLMLSPENLLASPEGFRSMYVLVSDLVSSHFDVLKSATANGVCALCNYF
jgi:hypothetical protein